MRPEAKLGYIPMASFKPASGHPAIGGYIKRTFDVIAAVLALLVLSPLFAILAILVKLSDKGPVFYGHTRVGRSGESFKCLKFRTMRTDGNAVLAQYLAENPEAVAEWEATRKLQNDPRVTVVGKVLRKLSLDELPQVINIMRGDMSIVGPRPVVSDELALYGPAAVYYLKSRPGLTGLWQVSGRNDVSYDSRVAFDTHYVENWSFITDLAIILRTVPAVLASRGSY